MSLVPPVIETRRLRIVRFAEEHLTPRYIGWLNDPDVTRFSEQRHVAHTLESCRQYWQSFDGIADSFWAIVARNATLGHLGNISVHANRRHGVADLGILIGERSVWGQGYGTEAWRAMCDHLFTNGLTRKITAGTLATNVGMLEIMRKVGMVDDGRRIRQQVEGGAEVDVVHGALFREDWLAKPR
jgi:RimJ/RimL family protein N-acetyltransferase